MDAEAVAQSIEDTLLREFPDMPYRTLAGFLRDVAINLDSYADEGNGPQKESMTMCEVSISGCADMSCPKCGIQATLKGGRSS